MQPWTDGYVTEVPYTAGHHAAMMPRNLALALLSAGIRPPDLEPGFTYCELGFGRGFSLALTAAANPTGRFYGNDFNPDHVGEAAALALRAGLDNLTVSGCDFAGYRDEDLPAFDIIALHGIWSWVDAGQRALLLDFIRHRLKPGGLVYLGYNVLPGWSQHLGLRRLMLDRLLAEDGPLSRRIPAAVAFAQSVARAGGGYFAANPQAAQRLELLAGRPVAYLAHEYFNQTWEPHYSADVAADLAGIGLTLAASALLADQIGLEALPSDARALLAAESDPVRRESLLDFLTNQPFRRDIYVRAPHPLSAEERQARLWHQPFLRLTAPEFLPSTLAFPRGEIPLERDLATLVLETLESGPATAAELAQGSGVLADLPADRLTDLLLALTAGDHLAPATGIGTDARAARRFNAEVLARSQRDDDYGALACAATGGAIEFDRIERLLLLAERSGADPVRFAADALAHGASLDDLAARPRGLKRRRQPRLFALADSLQPWSAAESPGQC
ncbi:class I SAM-dependent methyltransferase [Oleisolibacter albus]|uniref:class I SAM-dependent methyltransferase n=1 Tax=Oleisolibacter albus TaxID=2171757 RepID=UPI000DF2BCB5|nr:class I SAM-dependent methyltransferase [Oleisolibacter albus]